MPEYNMFAKDKRNNYPSAGLSPDQVSSMTYTMDELENGKGNVNPSVNSSPSLVNNNQVKANGSVNNIVGNPNIPSDAVQLGKDGATLYARNGKVYDSSTHREYPGGVNPTDGPDYLASLYTSPQQEEELRKSSVNKQRVMALADALRHIGNIYHTTRYSPSQQFNSPVLEERNRYLQEKAVRDANNYKFQTYQQAKAAQEAKIRQAERDFEYKVGKDARDFELNKQKADSQLKTDEARRNQIEAGIKKTNLETEYIPKNFEEKKRMNDNTIRHQKVTEQQGAQRIAISRANHAEAVRHHRVIENKGGGNDGKRDSYVFPSGSKFSFPKGFINTENINTLYRAMKDKGVLGVDNFEDKNNGAALAQGNSVFSFLGEDGKTNGEKWAAIARAASTREGWPVFKELLQDVYTYEGGLTDEYRKLIYGKPEPPHRGHVTIPKETPKAQPKPQPKAQAKAQPKAQPKSNVSAGTKPSAPKAGTGSKTSSNKNAYENTRKLGL